MPNPDRRLLEPAIEKVLRAARRGKSNRPKSISAYQIWDRVLKVLGPQDRARFFARYHRGGKGDGSGTGPYHVQAAIKRAFQDPQSPQVERTAWLETNGLKFLVANQYILAGYPVVGVYRWL